MRRTKKNPEIHAEKSTKILRKPIQFHKRPPRNSQTPTEQANIERLSRGKINQSTHVDGSPPPKSIKNALRQTASKTGRESAENAAKTKATIRKPPHPKTSHGVPILVLKVGGRFAAKPQNGVRQRPQNWPDLGAAVCGPLMSAVPIW